MEKLTEGYGLVEGPLWDPARGLIFSDVMLGGVYSLNPGTGDVTTVFEHRRGIGGMSLHVDGGLVVSGRNISFKPFDGGETATLLDRDEEAGNVGYNDITTDAMGRVYAGSLGASPVFEDGREPASGNLYLIDLDGSARIVAEDIALTNGLGFSPDGKTLYHSDSRRQTVNCYDVGEDGELGSKQEFVTFEHGVPDGLAVSEDGRVWVALAGGGHAVAVLDSNGKHVETIEIPLPMCTSVCFGGDEFTDLFITSGSDGAESDRAGAVFRYEAGVGGLRVPPARIKLGT